MLVWPLIKGATSGALTPARAVQLINREKAVLIDVSETEEFAQQHAGGAKNVPLGELEARLPAVVKNKAVPVILVCPSGGRAGRALPIVKKLGYEQAQVLAGGLKAWKEANLPVDKG
nr:rhodanese-like domain-containing protein [Xylophilus sp. ASV27]